MLITLIRKEISETVLDLRFMVTALLCVVLIPLGMYVNCKEYEQRLAGTQREHQMYRQRYGTPVKTHTWGEEEAQGFRFPSEMSLFASGLDSFLPDKVYTSPSGLFRTVRHSRLDNRHALLFGRMDFLFNVTFILSLAVMVISFSTISGERETGTLRLMIAHAVPRAQIILAKVMGRYVTVLVPFLLSVLIALLILEMSPDVSIGSREVWPAFLVILGATLLFLLTMMCLGICISTFTCHAMGSMVWLFFVWVVLVLGIPKMSPMIAEVLYPVESENVFSLAKRMAVADIDRELEQQHSETIEKPWAQERQQIKNEFLAKYKELNEKTRHLGGQSSDEFKAGREVLTKQQNDRNAPIHVKYQARVDSLAHEGKRRTAQRLRQMEQDYRNRRNVQDAVALNLSRLSPVACYSFIVSELSGTGVTEPENLLQNAQRFQDQVTDVFYDVAYARFRNQSRPEEYFKMGSLTLPDMSYTRPTLAQAVRSVFPDILLLICFSGLCLALTFMRFNRYDVR